VSGPGRDERQGPTFIRPLVDFLHTEAAGGVVLVAATVAALAWANSPWDGGYRALWETRLGVSFAGHALDLDLRAWVSEGLMALFFLVVGLEIKRELVEGELQDRRQAALPAVAALGGMAVPAALYLAINAGGEHAAGWGIPTATDIAMAIGVLSLLGRRVPASLKLFLLALAIVDDIGAVLVIAVVYTDRIDMPALAVAAAVVAIVAALRVARVRSHLPFAALGVALWLTMHEAGLHATLAGVVLGLMAPTQPARQPELIDAGALADVSTLAAARETRTLARDAVSVVEWLEHRLHPWTGFVIVPLFALANAGIPLGGGAAGDAAGSRVAAGVLVGLVVGKPLGITAAAWLAVRLRLARLPDGAGWPGIAGVGALAGIGFTVSVLVAGLALEDPATVDEAKLAVLAASLVASAAGCAVLVAAHHRTGAGTRHGGGMPEHPAPVDGTGRSGVRS
jgi:NhaA family Na+:H+ antiporter